MNFKNIFALAALTFPMFASAQTELYGYGSRDEMDAAAPDFIAETVAELEKILM